VKPPRNWRRLLRKIALRLLLIPILVVAFVVLLVYVPPVQHLIRGRAVAYLAGKTGTKVELERLRIIFPLDVRLEGLYVPDLNGDTLLHAGHINASLGLRALLQGRLLFKNVELSDVRADLRQDADSTFNFDFFITAFTKEDPATQEVVADTTEGIQLDLRSMHLERIHFSMHLQPSELDMQVRLGELDASLDTFDLSPLKFHLNSIVLRHTSVDMRTTSGEPTPPIYPALTNPLADIDVRFRTIDAEDVRFTLATTNTGDSLWVALQRGAMDAREMAPARQRLHLATADLVGLHLGTVSKAKPAETTDTDSLPLWLDQHDGFRFWTQDWDLAIDQLAVTNSDIAFHTDSISTPALLLDPAHLAFTGVGLGARDMQMNNGRIALQLDSLYVHGGPNGDRADLSAHVDATADTLSLTEGRITALGNSFTFRATAAPGDLSVVYRTPETVPLDAEVAGELRLADLLPLLHQFGVELPNGAAIEERWKTQLWVTGTAQDIQRAGIQLDGDQGSILHANGRISNPTQWPNSRYALTVEDLTMGAGIRQLMQAFAPPDVPLPQRLVLRGEAQGYGLDASAKVDLKSDLGDLVGHAEASGWKGSMPGMIDVDLKADRIAAARLTGDTALGPVSFTLAARGDGLHDDSRRGTLTLNPTLLTYNGNDLSSLRLMAEAVGDSLRLDLTTATEAVELDLHTEGPWPKAGDSLAMNVDLSLIRLHLRELGLTSHVLNAEGRITGRIALMPDQRGRIALQAPGLRIFNNERTFAFEGFALNGLLDADSTAVDLDSDVAHLAYHANLSLDSTLTLIRERLLSAFQEPYAFQPPHGRHIDLKVDLPGTQRLASLLLPELHAMEVKRFEGRYDSDLDALALNVDVPLLDYAGVEIKGFTIDLAAAGPQLEGELAVMRVMRDSLHVDDLVLQATNVPGALKTLLRLRNGKEDRYRIGLDLRREDGIPVAHLQEELVLDRNLWKAKSGNALYLDPDGLHAHDLVITSGSQRIELRTEEDGNHLDIEGFELANITGLVRSVDSLAVLHGTLDANVLLPLHDDERLKADLAVRELELMDVALGMVEAEIVEDREDRFEGSLRLDAGTNRASATFEVDVREEAPRTIVDSELDLKDLALFEPLAKAYLFDLSGALNGELHYEQDGDAVKVLGSTAITNGHFGLIQTGAVYRILNDTVTFDARGLAMNGFEVLDAKDNLFRLDGRINTGVDRDPELDLRLRTDRFQLVNSTAKDNPMFYGKLFSGIDLHIGGTATTPTVKGEVSVQDSTALSVVLPGSKVEMIDHEGIVQFTADYDALDTLVLKSDSEMLRDSLAAQLPGIDLDLRIKLDRNARFAIVIDPTTGDAASFRGEADLHFRYDPLGDIYLQGPFTVVDGGYTLEFYGLVKKRFELVPGGTIVWDGDPLAGRMDVQAKYSTKVAPYPLVANARGGLPESERNALQAPLPFDVLINIREAVQAPNISFGLDMDRQVRNSYPQVNSVLDQLAKPSNQEELNRQVFGLLVLSTFIENETGTTSGGSSLASTAARNSVNGILTQQLNRLTGQRIKGMDVQLGVNTYDQSEGGQSYSRTTVDYKVTQRILNDRVSIEAGGSLGYNEKKQDVSAMSNTKAPQYAIAYDVTKDGRLRLRVYHENAYDLYDGELVNNGVAIMLTRDFEKNAKELDALRKQISQQRTGGPTEENKQ
jgi:hypothetical protein